MNARQKRRVSMFVIASVLAVAALVVSYTRTTWMTENAGQVIVRMPTCTDTDWRVCQHVALVHLAQAVDKYPNAHQYKVHWRGQWLPLDETDYFEVNYDRQVQDLQEVNVGQADMDHCNHVTDMSIRSAAKTNGGFEVLAKYGAEHHPL